MQTFSNSVDHVSVLLSEFKKLFPKISGIWVDGTFGYGGYSEYLLQAGARKILVFDIDPDVRKYVKRVEKKWPRKLRFFNSNFSKVNKIIKSKEIEKIDGVLLDIGISSMQLDRSIRGFSFKNDGPLDMRMSKRGPTAEDFINNADENLISDVIFKYGEEKKAKTIARRIVKIREEIKIDTTFKLSKIIESVYGVWKKQKIHPATRSFQAIRIAINNELYNLVNGLMSSYKILKVGGFFAIITFHSLEDRIVKRFFNQVSKLDNPLNEIKKVGGNYIPLFEKINKKPIVPSYDEILINPRSRSAKLRIVKKISNNNLTVDLKTLGLPFISNKLREFQCE